MDMNFPTDERNQFTHHNSSVNSKQNKYKTKQKNTQAHHSQSAEIKDKNKILKAFK